MRLGCLVTATILLLVFIIYSVKDGKKYDEYIDILDSDDFPMGFLYAIGFSWSGTSILALRGPIRKMLVQQAKLIYGAEDAEYYAGVVWAQILGMTHFFLMVSMLIGAVLNQILITGICLIFTVVIIYYFSTKMKNQIKERSDQCTNELPEVVSSLALLINSGMILKNAWKTVAYSKDAEIYSLMKESCVEIENGVDEKNAIYRFGMKTNSVSVKKFTSVLCQGIEKGGSELITILMQQSSEMWSLKKQLMLQKGEEANAKILVPVALMFLGIIIIIITGSIGLMF